jgi:hypothetical protein
VIPVVDLRVRFGLKAGFTERTCIVVVQVKLPSEVTVHMGIIVDSVEEVVRLTASEIEPTPDFGARIDPTYLLGLAKVKGQVKMLLDIDRVIGADAMAAIARSTQPPSGLWRAKYCGDRQPSELAGTRRGMKPWSGPPLIRCRNGFIVSGPR